MKKETFKVGDVIDPQGQSNMIGKVRIRKIEGYNLYFTDSKETKYQGISQSQVRTLIENDVWKLEN